LTVDDIPEKFFNGTNEGYESFENHISKNWYIVFEIFLHLSARTTSTPFETTRKEKHNWKFSPGDLEAWELWVDKYQECYEGILVCTY
jgi:polyphosphate kinase 2 (PPK2 family)